MTIQRNFSPVITSADSPAIISFYLRADNPIPGPVTVAFRQDALPVFFLRISRSIFDTVRFSTTGAGTGPFEDLAAFQPEHWYFAEIEADIPNQRARARIDSGPWSDWLPFTTAITQIDRALIQIGSAFQITTSDITAYFDELRWRGE
ncbi:MAG: hypothetical protein HY456_01310 [Parcubacteria group bacterium]|nr:hypothetical protein [Parcubacteria group bacterium]